MRTRIIAALLFAVALAGCAERDPLSVSAGRIGDVAVRAPSGAITAFVVYVSDLHGPQPVDTDIVGRLVHDGMAVAFVDLSEYAAKLDADGGACLYVVGEITDLAQTAQRALGVEAYRAPIIVGRNEGATFAYAALADAPANTLGGAVAAGFANRLSLRLPFCPGATASALPDGSGFSYAFDRDVPEDGRLLVAPRDVDRVKADAASQPRLAVMAISPQPLADQIAAAVAGLSKPPAVAGLPVVPIKAQPPRKGIVVFVSGDGGWRDLDKTMGEWMAGQGYDVMGVDALRYFWSMKDPDRFAADLARIVTTADPTNEMPVLLIGYSFGADTLPFAWPKLPQDLRNRIGLVALLGPGLKTGFQISVSGWLGMSGGLDEVVPAIAAMPAEKVLCIHGAEEEHSACTDPAIASVGNIETRGGHHFDGDYAALGRRVLAAFGKTGR